MQESLTVQLLS